MSRGSELQTAVGKQDRRGATEHKRRQPDPTETLERETLSQQIGQQQQSGRNEPDC